MVQRKVNRSELVKFFEADYACNSCYCWCLFKMNQKQISSRVRINEEGIRKIHERMASFPKSEIYSLREKQTWTQDYLAIKEGVDISGVKRLLKKTNIEMSTAIPILKALEFDPLRFIDEHKFTQVSDQNLQENMMIDWRLICQEMLKEQQEERRFRKRATEQGFEVKVFLPLGLTKRKQQQRRDTKEFDNKKDPYQLQEEVIERIYKHDDLFSK